MRNDLPQCPVEIAIKIIGDKWRILILRELIRCHKESLRFSELKNQISNISDKMLSQNLKVMEEDGVLQRKVYAEVPPRVEYSLTELGRKLNPVLKSLFDFGKIYKSYGGGEI